METKTDYKTTKQQLITVPVPQDTRTYKAISNSQLIDLTLNSIEKAGFILDSEQYSSAREGQIANGKFTIQNVADSEMKLQIAFQNSYNKQISLKYAIGAKIIICSNGLVHGDMGTFKRKHQGTVQEFAPNAIVEYIKRSGDLFIQMQKEREEMKKIELTKRTKAELIGRMFIENEIIQSTQLGLISKEIQFPTYNYNSPNSLWELYQFTTSALRDIHPILYMEKHMEAHKFFVNEAGCLVSNYSLPIPEIN